ncbi:SDR family oxidoreductase [Ferrimonas senticii]|uniref:SDR family oxidoreductase n=1 Tax=Ferrimonas senticii TaxID=394566 RepID=UPI000407E151|nr:SDR family oxidoreductase [Ferrimonas senticii]
MSHNALAITGCGWLGLELALQLKQQGWQVSGCSRNPETLATLDNAGVTPIKLDLGMALDCDNPQALFCCDTLLINLPPGRHQQDNRYSDRLQLLCDAAKAHGVTQALFVSSTAVYQDGSDYPVVDEGSPLADNPRALTMLDGEAVIEASFERWMILRPGGLVGGQRHPGRFLAGQQHLAGAAAPVNLVHRDDVIAAIKLLLSQPQWGEIFNLAAPKWPSRGEFYPAAALKLGLTPPSFSDQRQTGKRVSSAKLQSLGFEFSYPEPLSMPPLTNA